PNSLVFFLASVLLEMLRLSVTLELLVGLPTVDINYPSLITDLESKHVEPFVWRNSLLPRSFGMNGTRRSCSPFPPPDLRWGKTHNLLHLLWDDPARNGVAAAHRFQRYLAPAHRQLR